MTKPVLNPEGVPTSDGQYVTVRIGGQLFGLPIAAVHEVFAPQRITPVPLAPAEIRGALNLRGRIVTMIDMHCLLGLAQAEKHVNMAAGIELKGESFGLIIDEVGEVLSLDAAKFEASPVNIDQSWVGILAGVYRMPGELLLVLDVERALARISAALAA
jgi:purine-binding chemotaxis protein CheW